MLKKLYHWVLHWSETPYGTWALFILAFSESSFFPLPPDVLLIALAVGKPEKSMKFAAVCTLGSVLGGMLGYLIGWQFMAAVGEKIVEFYGLTDKVDYIEVLYNRYDAWAVGIAGFTPIPYKVFTIAAGAFKISFVVFIVASTVSRSARFFLVGGLIYFFGPGIQAFIDKYFNLLAVVFTVLLVGSFVLLKYIF
ncbi:MAG: DedA family protein [Deltaproteobacteria bacterium]|nr:DedA family protein [Deltaproteobacteria bacterium]MBW2632919.1 DedA family protein [Deltaproteobacteria bacterium]MBW2677947.1 DedA family protein [Deltaproteobacteria bacterium]